MHNRNEACPRMLRYRPPRVAMTFILFATALHLLTPATWPAPPSSVASGALVALLGCSIMLRAWWLFRKRETAICPTARASVLITHDIYRMTRNPMYLGIVLMLLGLAVATGGVFFYLACLAFFLVADYVFCTHEETKLAGIFGAAYRNYLGTVRRWL